MNERDREERIAELKKRLAETDYVTLKILENASSFWRYETVIKQREEWRREINELEKEGAGA